MAPITLQSEVTGTVWKIQVHEGEAVAAGQTLVVLESMKMEIPLVAPQACTVLRLLVPESEPVAEGQDLVVLG